MKTSRNLQFLLKIAILSLFFVGIFQGYHHFFAQKSEIIVPETENAQLYQSAYAANIGSVGVALSTRIGMQYQSNTTGLQSGGFYKEIVSLGNTIEERRKIRGEMIAQNMLIIQEYLNLSKTDIKVLLNNSPNRKATLESFISQLELRYKNSAISLQSLASQKALLLKAIEKNQTAIETTKNAMQGHFASSLASETLGDVDTYFILRSDYTEAFTDIVFINQFIKQHEFLNNYNKVILDTLINNKEAIINQSYVVIPDSGSQYLRPLDLLFNEADYKATLQEK